MENIIANTVRREGGYVDNPDDRGGKTKYGITEKVARQNGYEGDMKDLPLDFAVMVYKKKFWDIIHLDEIINPIMREFMFDACVHHGPRWAVRIAQRAYNALNKDTIMEDGVIGPQTVNALNIEEYQQDLCVWYLLVRGNYMYDIANNDSSQKTFIRGWGNRLEGLLQKIL